ncbi:MAG: ATP-binding protein [Blastomonas sp.]
MKRLSRSIFSRTVLVAGLATLAGAAILFAVTLYTLTRADEAALARMVDTDLAGLADIHASGGLSELKARIDDRLALAPMDGRQPYYLLADGAGRKLAGNLGKWPELSAENSEAGEIATGKGERAAARATQLGPDVKLVVARGLGERQRLIASLATTFAITALALAALVLLTGGAAAFALRKRVDAINTVFSQLAEGDFTARTESGRDDELGELALHANHMVHRVGALVTAHRDMSDHVAHEIRTPLMHLDMRLVRALESTGDSALQESLGKARTDIRNIVRLLDSLLDIAASEARKGDVSTLENCNLSELAENIAELYAESAIEQNIVFERDIADHLWMRCEPMQITRLITNLLDNAFKYVDPGGTVRLTVGSGPRIEVSDNGPGIPEAFRASIFDRFRRAGQGKAGHGLGLALARAIADRHNLAIRLADSMDGTRIVIQPEDQP